MGTFFIGFVLTTSDCFIVLWSNVSLIKSKLLEQLLKNQLHRQVANVWQWPAFP